MPGGRASVHSTSTPSPSRLGPGAGLAGARDAAVALRGALGHRVLVCGSRERAFHQLVLHIAGASVPARPLRVGPQLPSERVVAEAALERVLQLRPRLRVADGYQQLDARVQVAR